MASFSDNFNRADGAPGGNWVDVNGTWTIVSNALTVNTLTSGQAREKNTTALTGADYTVQGDVSFADGTSGNYMGVIGRFDGTNTFYGLLKLALGDLKMYYVNAGTFNQLGSTFAGVKGSGLNNNITIQLKIKGNQISGYENGILQIGPITDNNIATAGVFGTIGAVTFASYNAQIDNFVAADIPAATTSHLLASTGVGS